MLSIGRAWVTLASALVGAAPSRVEGESARTSCGKRASSSRFSRISASYWASEISGASSSWYSRSWRAISFASRIRRLAAWASVSSVVTAEQFFEQVDKAGPAPFRGKRIVGDAVDLELARVRVREAVADVAVGVDLPVAPGLRQLIAERDHGFRRHHRVVPAVEADDLRLDLLLGQPGRVEQAVEADRRGDVRAAPRKIERALAAEAIAGDDNLLLGHAIGLPRDLEHVLEAAAKPGAVLAKTLHLAEADVARRAVELLAEQVGDERIVAEL